MPAKYISPYPKGEEFRRRAMQSHGRNSWKKPEPPSPPKPKQWFVLGMEVDYNTYREYNYEKTWTIDGDVLKGLSCTLWLLESYATDEHAKKHPIEAANARKILDQIREEISTAINRKDDKAMNKQRTTADFIGALADVYNGSRNEYGEAEKKLNAAKAVMDQAEKSMKAKGTELAAAEFSVAKGQYVIAQDEFRKTIRDIQVKHDREVTDLRSQFADHLDDHYSASPEKLDNDTLTLLNSGICTAAELAKLATRHANNPTMLRIVASHANKMKDRRSQSKKDYDLCAAVAVMAQTVKDGSRELAIFDSAASAAVRGIQTDAHAAARMHNYITGWLDDYKSKVENLPNVPAVEGATE